MPGVHHKNGVWIVAGENIQKQRLPVLGIAQGGALIYTLLGLPIPNQVDTSLPGWLNTLLPSTRSKEPEAVTNQANTLPTEQSSVLNRLHAMGYLD